MIGISENIPGESKSMITDGVLSDMFFFPYALVLLHLARTGSILVPCCRSRSSTIRGDKKTSLRVSREVLGNLERNTMRGKRAALPLQGAVFRRKFLSFSRRPLCSANCLCDGALPVYVPVSGLLWFLSIQIWLRLVLQPEALLKSCMSLP